MKQLFIISVAMLIATASTGQGVSFAKRQTHLSKRFIANSEKKKIARLKNIRDNNAAEELSLNEQKKYSDKNGAISADAINRQIKEDSLYVVSLRYMTRSEIRNEIKELRHSQDTKTADIQIATQKRIIELSETYKDSPEKLQKQVNLVMDSAEDEKANIRSIFQVTRVALRENSNERNLFPAVFSREAIAFFTEKDTLVSKFFSDNSLLYNSSLQKLTYSSEAYADYFGPIRLGIGYTITSSSKSTDTAKEKSDAIQKIISNGGNLNYNINYPLLEYTNGNVLQLKATFTHKGGVDIPKDSSAASTYGFLTSTGMNLNLYSVGIQNVIQLFFTSRLAYILGNKNFENHVQQNSFWLWQNSIGVAVKDKFRIRFDIYKGLSGEANKKYVNANFPVTLSFDIVNPF